MNQIVRFVLFILPGTVLIITTIILGWVILPSVIRSKIEERAKLVKGTETWDNWEEVPIPLYLKFYIHHITNPGQVEDGFKPIFQEKGPYVYREKRKKVSIRQDDGPNTVKYREVTTFNFDQQLSGNNTEKDLVNIINIPFVAVLHSIQKRLPIDFAVGIVGNFILFNENLIRTDVPVKEVLFDGVNVMKYTNSLLGSQLPEEFSGGRFGLYKGRNGTASKEWEIYTGYDNPKNFGKIKTWDGRSELGYWQKYSKCDKILGTDGSLFTPFIRRTTALDIFSPDVCSALSIRYVKDVNFKGITGYRFMTPKLPSDDPEVRERNKCFCVESDPDKCPLAGALALEPCRQAPIYSSLPYFLNADVRLLAQSGLANPNATEHETYLDIEPITGLILRAHKRLQISIKVSSNRKVRALQHLTQESTIFPVIWADETAELTDELVSKLNSSLFTPVKIIDIGKWVGIGFGILLLLLGLSVFIYRFVIKQSTSNKRASATWRAGTPIATDSTIQKQIPKEQAKHHTRNQPRRSQILSSSSSSMSTNNTENEEIQSNGNYSQKY